MDVILEFEVSKQLDTGWKSIDTLSNNLLGFYQ